MLLWICTFMILGDVIPAQALAPGGGFESSELWMFQRTRGITHSRLKCCCLPHHWILFHVLAFRRLFQVWSSVWYAGFFGFFFGVMRGNFLLLMIPHCFSCNSSVSLSFCRTKILNVISHCIHVFDCVWISHFSVCFVCICI